VAKEESLLTPVPPSDLDPPKVKLSKAQRLKIGESLYSSLISAQADRKGLTRQIQDWNKLWEGQVDERAFPWPGCANIYVPVVQTQVQMLTAELSTVIYQDRFYTVQGNTPTALSSAPQVEKFYNKEYNDKKWDKAHYDWAQSGILDGACFMQVLWRKETRKRNKLVYQQTNDEGGVPVPDGSASPDEKGVVPPLEEEQVISIDQDIWNGVELKPVRLRDFYMFPAWNPENLDEPQAVAVREWLDENMLKKMVRSGILYKDAVKRAIAYATETRSERNLSEDGTDDIDVGSSINIGAEQGSLDSELNPQKGQLEVFRFHSRQFDLDKDDEPEENIYWFSRNSRELLGVVAYPYWAPKRPFFDWAPIPRPGKVIGFSLVGLLAGLANEIMAIHNQRRDWTDLITSPPLLEKQGAKLDTRNYSWGPAAKWKVSSPDDVSILKLPDAPASSIQEEGLLTGYAKELAGAEDIQQTGQRQTKAQVMASQFKVGIRTALIAERFRDASREIVKFVNELNIQYGPKDQEVLTRNKQGAPETFILPKKSLVEDYTWDINGAGGPIDKQQKLSECLVAYKMLLSNPLVATDMPKIYNVTRWVLEQMDVPSVEDLIGTEKDAQAKQKQMEQQQAQQAQMQLAGMAPQDGQPNPGTSGSSGTDNQGGQPPDPTSGGDPSGGDPSGGMGGLGG